MATTPLCPCDCERSRATIRAEKRRPIRREIRIAKPRETEGGTGEVLDSGPRAPSFFSIVSGAPNTDWASGLPGDLSPGEDIDGLKPPVVDVDNGEGWWGRELAGVDFAFELELEDVPVVVNERRTSHAVRILDSSPLHILRSVSEILKKGKKKNKLTFYPSEPYHRSRFRLDGLGLRAQLVRLTGSHKTKRSTPALLTTKKNRNERLKLGDEFSELLDGAFIVDAGRFDFAEMLSNLSLLCLC